MSEETQTTAPAKPGELLVFMVRREALCTECGAELFPGAMLMLNREKGPLCLQCADLDHLEFLPRGDAAVTRRATKHSTLHAVVLQWSRTRKRYERQGVLVDPVALERAEAECLQDADARARLRERRRIRDADIDRQYVGAFATRLRELYPGAPPEVAEQIAGHACRKHSGRVGRSAAARQLDPDALRLAVAAAIRHRFTNYDELLLAGRDRHEARAIVGGKVEVLLEKWRAGAVHSIV